jgi:alpha-tubulin suppressor-like RCC1 family protein
VRALVLATLLITACQSGAAIGGSCTRASDCASGTCAFGRCRSACAENRDCPIGASCLRDASGSGACSVAEDLGCETGVGRVCPSGLACVGDRCEQTCTSPSDCPSDGVCLPLRDGGPMFCFDPRVAGDAGSSDAPMDAGASCAITSVCFERAIAACASDCMGRVWCWGEQHGGHLGNGLTTDGVVTTPTAVLDDAMHPIAGVDSLACGDGFACVHVASAAATHGGHVLCWGWEPSAAFDTVPHPTATDLRTPIVGDAIDVRAGRRHACVLDRSAGTVACFGANDAAIEPLMSDDALFPMPTAPAGGVTGATALSLASFGGCAVVAAGHVQCWGDNEYGESGHVPIESMPGVFDPNVGLTTIETAPGVPLTGVEQIAAGYSQRAALARASASAPLTLFTWGGNEADEIGEPPTWSGDPCEDQAMIGSVCRARAATPLGAIAFSSIAADGDAELTCGVVAASGHVLCWGADLAEHAGVVATGNVWLSLDREVVVDGGAVLDRVRPDGVFVGFANACAIRTDGTLWCWGPNADAQLARPIDTNVYLAVPIAFPF